MMRRAPFATLALLILAGQLGAAPQGWAGPIDPPRYDSDLFCRLRANTPEGFSDDAQAQCLASQNMAYQEIRKQWDELPAPIQGGCTDTTQARDPLNYQALYSCIEMQKRRLPPAPDVDEDPPG